MTLLHLFIFITFPFTTTEAHVVFEEIGQMSGSTSYIHLTVSIDLAGLEDKVDQYTHSIGQYKSLVNSTYGKAISDFDQDCLVKKQKQWTCEDSWRRQLSKDHSRYLNLGSTFLGDAGQLKGQIRNLRGVLPTPDDHGKSFPSKTNPSEFEREKRSSIMSLVTRHGSSILKGAGNLAFKMAKQGVIRQVRSPTLLFSLAKGVLGTFMGLYTQVQINKLRNQVDDLQAEHNQLVEVVAENKASISRLESWMTKLNFTVSVLDKINPGIVVAEMNSMYQSIKSAIEVAVHAVQQAMHRRLSIDLLSPDDLSRIFEDLTELARTQGFKLLTSRPSDLLQIETSYIYDGSSFILLLHVPMTPADSLLRLMRLRPFPIPFSDTHSLLPKAPTSLLALSKGKTRLMTTIEHSDLVGCHQVGSIYTCDRHGALRKDIKASCLGALYEQDIPEARKLCDLELVPRKEAVLQLENNWFLVYSPKMFTARIDCHNGTSNEAYIKRDVQKVYVDPGCSLDLVDHQLNSEHSLYLDQGVRWIKWEKEDISLFGLSETDVELALNETGMREKEILLADVVKSARARDRFPIWKILIGAISVLSLLSLVAFFSVPLVVNWVGKIQARIRKLKDLCTSLLPTLAEQINRILRHLHFPQLSLPRFNLYPAIPAAPENDQPIPQPPGPNFDD